jgi:hypothetical protein
VQWFLFKRMTISGKDNLLSYNYVRTVSLVVKSQNSRRMHFCEFIVSLLALSCSRSSRIARIEVPGNEFLTTTMGDLAYEVVIVAVGRSREGGSDADDAIKGVFDTAHLGVYIFCRECREVLMGPGVRCNHVSLAVGKLDTFDVFIFIDASV